MTIVTSSNFFTTGETIQVQHEGDAWWASCPGCPGWTAVSDSWKGLFDLVAEFHARPEANHRDWLMVPVIDDRPVAVP